MNKCVRNIYIPLILLMFWAGVSPGFQGEFRDIPLNELIQMIASDGGFVVEVPAGATWLASLNTGPDDVLPWKALHITAAAYGLSIEETSQGHFKTSIIEDITGDPAEYKTGDIHPVSGGHIKNGIVWAYGKRVDSPFSIEIIRNEVQLCGATVFPTPVRDANIPRLKQDIITKHQLSNQIIEIGNLQGMERAVEFAHQSPIIQEAFIADESIEIRYSDGEEESIYFGEMRHGTGDQTVSEDDLTSFAAAIVEILEEGGMIVFGYNYYRAFPSEELAEEVDSRVIDALLSGGSLRDKYSRIFGASWERDFALEVIHNN
ncbi:MAG: hypothetical protein JW737_10255 [Acidobacteria bacterium]|nr:hypothetical protein [Acidobacteriota bacterium]